jgi:hypothetical protein
MPKIENSFAIAGKLGPTSASHPKVCKDCGALQKVGFSPQGTISGDGVEMTFIPTLSIPGEWQGTVISTRYDVYGSFIDQYVADIVMVQPDPNINAWDVVFEVSFDLGVPYLQYEPGMYTGFDLGVPIQEHQPSYELRREQLDLLYQVTSLDRRAFKPVGFQIRSDRNFYPPPRPPSQPRPVPAPVRAWARCSFAPCSFFGGGCIVANLWNADLLAGPCFALGCGGAMAACTYGTLYR